MKTQIENGVLTIFLEGRIDTGNAPEVEKDILTAFNESENSAVVVDAEELQYISSAGLRVLMKLRKKSGKPLEIYNVSKDVYDIFETTGFTELFNVKKAYRSMSVDGLEVIGTGFFGTVYRIDSESIVKVYMGKEASIPMIENEKKMAKKAFVNGIPTAISYDIVKVGENYGSVFELINAKTLHEAALEEKVPLESTIEKYTDLLKTVHKIPLDKEDFPSFRDRFYNYLEVIKIHLNNEVYEGLKRLLHNMEDEDTFVHGDIQMKNVMLSGDELLLIDMDTIGRGNPVFELAGLFVTYQEFEEDEPENSMAFLGMTQEMVDEIWKLILVHYFDFKDDTERQSTVAKIRLVATIRFLYLIESTALKESDLGKLRIRHTRAHIEELLKTVDNLAI